MLSRSLCEFLFQNHCERDFQLFIKKKKTFEKEDHERMGNFNSRGDEEEDDDELMMNGESHVVLPAPTAPPIIPSNNNNNNSSNWSDYPLHHAAATGAPSSELNRLVVHEGYDVDQVDGTGSTPLHLAAYYGHEHCAKWLLNKGRARYIKDFDGNTPADLARQCGNLALAESIEEQMNPASLSVRPRSSHNRNNGGSSHGSSGGLGGGGGKEEQLYLELDRAQSKIASLKASEKRARQELEQEVAERVKLFRAFVGNQQQVSSNDNNLASSSSSSLASLKPDFNALDVITDMRLQIVEYKSQRDSMAAELKLVEEAISDFELFLTGERSKQNGSVNEDYISPSARIKACLRKV